MWHAWENRQVRVSVEIKGVDISAVATAQYKFKDICAVVDQVVLALYSAQYLLVFDGTTEEVTGMDTSAIGAGNYMFDGICAVLIYSIEGNCVPVLRDKRY